MPTPSNCLRNWDIAHHIRIDDTIAPWCGVEPSELATLNVETQCMSAKRTGGRKWMIPAAGQAEGGDGQALHDPAEARPHARCAQKKPGERPGFCIGGGAEGDRTLDLRIANATLSQLSYRPTRGRAF